MRPVVAVIAHPDDEAFGPGGTLALLSETRDVYLICVTNGDAGENNSLKKEPLAAIRRDELLASAGILGIKKVFFLDFKDGTLCNNLYHDIADRIRGILSEIKPEIVITNELHGISGHLDHIAVSFITSFVCKKLPDLSELWYFCLTFEQTRKVPDYFVYFPPGYPASEINKTVNIKSVWTKKIEAIKKHESQFNDMQRMLEASDILPKTDHFIVKKQKDL